MEREMKDFLREIRKKDVREFVNDHVREIRFDKVKREFALFVDKRYAINILRSSEYIWPLTDAAKRHCWEDISTILHVKTPHHAHDREMLVPYSMYDDSALHKKT